MLGVFSDGRSVGWKVESLGRKVRMGDRKTRYLYVVERQKACFDCSSGCYQYQLGPEKDVCNLSTIKLPFAANSSSSRFPKFFVNRDFETFLHQCLPKLLLSPLLTQNGSKETHVVLCPKQAHDIDCGLGRTLDASIHPHRFRQIVVHSTPKTTTPRLRVLSTIGPPRPPFSPRIVSAERQDTIQTRIRFARSSNTIPKAQDGSATFPGSAAADAAV